jgi:phosphatidylethanolamine/phosphatidyl-N-methylethanolamine N-methyltransferase
LQRYNMVMSSKNAEVITTATDTARFFANWLQNPSKVAAVAPSGRALAMAITAEISKLTGPVIELGPGTGVFTRALLERGVQEQDLILIETEQRFTSLLHERYPAAHILNMDAARLGKLQIETLVHDQAIGAVVSGLPMLTLSTRTILSILRGVFTHLRADGAMYQFTYGPRCPVNAAIMKRLNLRAERISIAWANLPPASVYKIQRI